MAVPALFYTLFNFGTTTAGGWGIPTATDIAFAVGIMSILGNRVPVSLKVFLTALAIADDLGAILVVAFFYGGDINMPLLFIALILLAAIFVMNKLGEKRMMFYLIPAIVVWFLFYYSGIHSTMSGVVMAFMIPMDARFNQSYLKRNNRKYIRRLKQYDSDELEQGVPFPNGPQRHCLRRMSYVNNNSIGMSYRLEHVLDPWVNFLIMPIFALANAGVVIPDVSFFNIFQALPLEGAGMVGMGIFFGLLLGKPVGITLASFIAIKCKIGAMPEGATWKMLFAVACLGGIGFTMAIFVDTLSFGELCPEATDMLRSSGKIAVLLGSLSAGILGSLLITLFDKMQKK
jgi:NhaA family Na+:H+ antiporter